MFDIRISRQKIGSYVSASFLCISMLLSMISATAYAQSESSEIQQIEVPQGLGPDAMQALVSKLDRNQTAALVELIELLNASADNAETLPEVEGQGTLVIVKRWFAGFGANLKAQLQSFPQMAASVGKSIGLIFEGRGDGGNLTFLLLVALTIGSGIIAEWLFKRGTRDKREKIRQSRPEALIDTLKVLLARAGIEIGSVVVFTIVAIIALNLLIKADNDFFLVSAFILNVIVIVRITGSAMHFVLAPRRPELRLVYTGYLDRAVYRAKLYYDRCCRRDWLFPLLCHA